MRRFSSALILPAAGIGARMGRKEPKPLIPIAGRPAIYYTISAFASVEAITQIIIPSRPEMQEQIEAVFTDYFREAELDYQVIDGGDNRFESVEKGLAHIRSDIEIVAVHDAVRPLVQPKLITSCLETAFSNGAALLAVPCRDTLKKVDAGNVSSTVDRSGIWHAQTPQCFRKEVLVNAFNNRKKDGSFYTDEASLVENVRVIEGDSWNIKLTFPEDIEMAEMIMQHRNQ